MSEERTAFLEYVGLNGDDERWVRVTYCGPALDMAMLTALADYVARTQKRSTPDQLLLAKLPVFDPMWPDTLQQLWFRNVSTIIDRIRGNETPSPADLAALSELIASARNAEVKTVSDKDGAK